MSECDINQQKLDKGQINKRLNLLLQYFRIKAEDKRKKNRSTPALNHAEIITVHLSPNKARFKRRSIHAPNLTDELSTAEERRLRPGSDVELFMYRT